MWTVLPIKNRSGVYVTTAGILVSLGLALHYAESLVPFLQILPGGKLGLANITVMLAFSCFGTGFALTVGLVRCFLTALIGGNLTMFLYGGVGTAASVLAMHTCRWLFPKAVSTVGRSMLGAFFFNVGQISVCALVLLSGYIFSYLPILTLFAAICGLLTGIATQKTEKAIRLMGETK